MHRRRNDHLDCVQSLEHAALTGPACELMSLQEDLVALFIHCFTCLQQRDFGLARACEAWSVLVRVFRVGGRIVTVRYERISKDLDPNLARESAT